MDPIEFRIRNCLRDGDSTVAGGHVSRPRAVEVLETLRDETGWGQRPTKPNVGRGIALRDRHVGMGKGEVLFRVQPDGTIEALAGTADQGGGAHTVIQRVAAAALSVNPSRIRVRYGTTDEALWDSGAGGSRATHVVGSRVTGRRHRLKEKLQDLAAEAMGWPAGQVRLERDRFVVGDGSAERASFEDVVSRIAASGPRWKPWARTMLPKTITTTSAIRTSTPTWWRSRSDPETGQVHPRGRGGHRYGDDHQPRGAPGPG